MRLQERLNKFWPKKKTGKDFVPAAFGKECLQCGRCCALIRISCDFEYFIEKAKHYIYDTRRDNGVLPESESAWWADANFIMKHWVRVSRWEVVQRAFRDQVESTDFFYSCKLLQSDGSCAGHGEWRPHVCTDYPYYGATKKHQLGGVFRGCGFADIRYKHGKFVDKRKNVGKKEALDGSKDEPAKS